ncbi:RNA methyltransferase [Sulfuricurvum sp. RIFCSPLOWO2_12_FULL_43_24]|uniref:TrmH family RNA methyltransferase n=1 Tax=Sulfuricurvum sp. RIFCSPLOWO2_12_FULL_43_24 TaxID=1802247 RepID=UPI0008C7188D|nr:RNA methyltransferase [Sulfuricurvum sp. RIFCSPLOWO2_12_FULL_43_24]OHD85388.1 MAG: 23S rRNA (guanosine(2251)-2'-O)-methyltransferase RlmB [Sulfuricurvum sp. RIFCSPLOWO2_02_FULL_43_45]OHD90289.1 MAG: 23S rRNA (guanosine(2251)-2'-O)-methyltransferase RlmB [Sulfuricurvum sp. RIFCSPLOWO2_12_FULL_43_24]
MNDSPEYLEKKRFFDSLITLYGRNVAVEVLRDQDVQIHKLHLSKSNRSDETIEEIMALAQMRGVEIKYHTKESLSRISKNSAQDQGVAIDVVSQNYRSASNIATDLPGSFRLLALDGINNPQNLGMIVRSAAASRIDGIVLPRRNSTKLSPLVMKASAGTLFKIPIYYCEDLSEILTLKDTAIITLSSHAHDDIHSLKIPSRAIFVLGNESEGVSDAVMRASTHSVSIPMYRGVESLNVAVTAGIVSFLP